MDDESRNELPRVSWSDAMRTLVKNAEGDIFVLMNCHFNNSYAGSIPDHGSPHDRSTPDYDNLHTRSIPDHGNLHVGSIPDYGKKFEILATGGLNRITPRPGEDSFTTALIQSLKELAAEFKNRSFSTQDLHEKILVKQLHSPPALWGTVPNNRHIRLSPMKDQDEAKKESLANEDTWSIPSFPSLTAGSTISTKSFSTELRLSTDHFVDLLVGNVRLQGLFSEALKTMSSEKLERNFMRLLKNYTLDLHREANGQLEHDAISFIKSRRGAICQAVLIHVDPRKREQSARLQRLANEAPQRAEQLESYFQSKCQELELYDRPGRTPDSDDDSDDGGIKPTEMPKLPNLERVQNFLMESAAFDQLTRNFKSFINTTAQSKGKEDSKDVRESGIKKEIEENDLLSDGSEPSNERKPLEKLTFSQYNDWFRLGIRSSFKTIIWVAMYRYFTIWFRPRVKNSYVRITWNCVSDKISLNTQGYFDFSCWSDHLHDSRMKIPYITDYS